MAEIVTTKGQHDTATLAESLKALQTDLDVQHAIAITMDLPEKITSPQRMQHTTDQINAAVHDGTPHKRWQTSAVAITEAGTKVQSTHQGGTPNGGARRTTKIGTGGHTKRKSDTT